MKRYLVAGDEEFTSSEVGLDTRTGRTAISVPAAVPLVQRSEEAKCCPRKDTKPESLKSLIQGVKSEAEQNAIGAALSTDRLEPEGGGAIAEG